MLYSFYKNIYIFLLFLLNITNELKYKTKKLIFEYLFIHNYIFFYIFIQKKYYRSLISMKYNECRDTEILFRVYKLKYTLRKSYFNEIKQT